MVLHEELDRVSAKGLVEANVAAIVNGSPSITVAIPTSVR